MKKFIIFIMFIFVLMPGIALADDINLEIKEVKLVEKSENAEIVADPKINELAIDFNIKLNALNDYVKYKVILNNKDKYLDIANKISSYLKGESTLKSIIPYINKDVIKKCGKHEKTVKITYVIDKNSLLIKKFK